MAPSDREVHIVFRRNQELGTRNQEPGTWSCGAGFPAEKLSGKPVTLLNDYRSFPADIRLIKRTLYESRTYKRRIAEGRECFASPEAGDGPWYD